MLFFLVLIDWGCSHAVYQSEVQPLKKILISEELKNYCGEDCEILKCWRETKDLSVCKVVFAFYSDDFKKETLFKVSKELHSKGVNVGFCAYNSMGTKLFNTFFHFLGVALTAAATRDSDFSGRTYFMNSNVGDTVTSIYNRSQYGYAWIGSACSTTPVASN